MGRTPKGPWYRTSHRAWYATVKGRKVHLGPDEAAAWELFRRLVAERKAIDTTPERLVTAFLAARRPIVKPRTLSGYRAILEPFAGHVGEMPAADVGPEHVASYSDAHKHGPNTSRQDRRVVKMAWSWAVEAGLIPSSKLRGLRCGVVGRRSDVGDAELAVWMPHCTCPSLRLYVEVGLGTGMRPGEIVRIEWRHVDPVRRRLSVTAGKTGDRHVPLGLPILARLRDLAGERPTGPLLRAPNGRPWKLRNVAKRFELVSSRAGVALQPMHLRHIFASRMAIAGTPELVLARIMGHTSPAMIARYYVQIPEAAMLAALDRVG